MIRKMESEIKGEKMLRWVLSFIMWGHMKRHGQLSLHSTYVLHVSIIDTSAIHIGIATRKPFKTKGNG